MKVAFAFFGITRSLTYTIASIKKNLFGGFEEYDIFVHTYKLSSYSNVRAKETMVEVNNEEVYLLGPDYLLIDDQEEIKTRINITSFRTKGDPWQTGFNTLDNFILAQYSKLQLTSMIEKSKKKYDYIFFVRPDCLYPKAFDLQFLRTVNNDTIVIPNFCLFGPYNFNDRFCIANMHTYKLYGCVFNYLLDMSKTQELHSETVLGKIMVDEHNLRISRVGFHFCRVRCHGEILDKCRCCFQEQRDK